MRSRMGGVILTMFWTGRDWKQSRPILRPYFSFYRCTVHLDITKVFHSPTDALFINPRKL
jgi:hypothetical protein